ncbi:MAG: GNAT family N-acetyltransferase [Nitrosotalea sp.]
MKTSYLINPDLKPNEVVTLFVNSGIKRPVNNIERIKRMIENANLIICARNDKKLIGILRAVTDFSYCCYVSDLAVDKKYRRLGIGKKLLKLAQKTLGKEVMILLLSAPETDSFYSHIGIENIQNAWKIARKR